MRARLQPHVCEAATPCVRGCNPTWQVSFMSPGQALVEIHPSRKRGFDDYVHAAVSLGVTYRAVYASGAWRGLGTVSGDIPVAEVMSAVDAATASAPRDRSRLEEMARRAVQRE